jgi:pyruvate/2-oxoglutarate dehydrogenase complex dihydrolipoamide dehydrogenase (E3) component
MKQVKARKDEIVSTSNEGVTTWVEGMGVSVIRGHARFVDRNTIQVGGQQLRAERIFLDVGARARVPDLEGLDGVDYLTNSTIMDLDTLPEHLIIVGGSYIGLEFAQVYRRFGSEVTVVEMTDRLIGRDDEDVSTAVQEILEKEGVQFRLKAECVELAAHADGVQIRVSCDEEPKVISGSHLLLAVGRVPNTDDLGLGKAGVEVDAKGFIQVDDQLRTMFPESGPSARSMAEGHSRTPRTMISRSLPAIFSTTMRGASASAYCATDCSSTRRWAGWV